MEFKTNKPIYQQIVDFCFSKILTREWRAEERVVSVRGAFYTACREFAHRNESLRIPTGGRHYLSGTGYGLLSGKGCGEESDEDTEERILRQPTGRCIPQYGTARHQHR